MFFVLTQFKSGQQSSVARLFSRILGLKTTKVAFIYCLAICSCRGHSEQLQLIWMISQIFNAWLVTLALSKVSYFLGYYTIFKRLVGLSSFWSLIVIYGMCIVGYLLIIGLKNDTTMEIALILAFLSAQGSQVILIGLLTR